MFSSRSVNRVSLLPGKVLSSLVQVLFSVSERHISTSTPEQFQACFRDVQFSDIIALYVNWVWNRKKKNISTSEKKCFSYMSLFTAFFEVFFYFLFTKPLGNDFSGRYNAAIWGTMSFCCMKCLRFKCDRSRYKTAVGDDEPRRYRDDGCNEAYRLFIRHPREPLRLSAVETITRQTRWSQLWAFISALWHELHARVNPSSRWEIHFTKISWLTFLF